MDARIRFDARSAWRRVAQFLSVALLLAGCATVDQIAGEMGLGGNSNGSARTTHVAQGGQSPEQAVTEKPAPDDASAHPNNAGEGKSGLRLTSFRESKQPETENSLPAPETTLPKTEKPPDEHYPINLATALQLAGANNLQIALASERIEEAQARLDGAEVLWIPTFNVGVGYNSHTGQIQATEGDVFEVNRESAFVGGGPVLSGAPLTGGSGGPARFFVDLSLADVFFEPLAARQAVRAAESDSAAMFNDTLLQVTVTYLELLQAQNEVGIAREAVEHAEELVRQTEVRARTGEGLEADAQRARAELADRRRELAAAKERVRVVSAELARQLRLEPDVVLQAVEPQPVPLPLIADDRPLGELIEEALVNRPELGRQAALVDQTLERVRQEELRPWLPNLHLGASSGGFGGGPGGFFGNFSDRTDFDALAVWELRNLGLGNRALQRERESQHRQAHLAYEQIRDRVAAEITQAYQRVQYREKQIERARSQMKAAAEALPLNFTGIRGGVLRPIEAQQAIGALAAARRRYLAAVTNYNQAQFQLLRALGRPPESPDADETSGGSL